MIEVELRQFAGYSKGVYKTEPIDQVFVVKADGSRVSVGFLPQKPNATLRFHRYLHKDVREAIRSVAADLRLAATGWPISLLTVGPADPRKIRSVLKGETTKKRKSTIWVPEGTHDDEG